MLHKDLEVYKSSILIVKRVYELTKEFPKNELFGLVSQLRRASISIPSNIAEGAARRTNNELVQFLHIAMGSASELETQIEISCLLGFISAEETKSITIDIIKIRKCCQGSSNLSKSP